MVYDSSFLLTVKDRVTEKLKTLGAFIDDELPDYIMVMVANKKSESAMAKDLQLFLGEHTNRFTEWLHLTLENLKASGRDSSDGRKDNETVRSSRSKSGRRKGPKARSSESHSDSPPKYSNRSRSRSPLGSVRHGRYTNSSREPHGEIDGGVKAAADVYISDDNGSYHIKEERKILSTSSLSRKVPQESEKSTDLSDKSNSLQSVVEVKNSDSHKHSRTKQEYPQPSSLLLKRAVNEAKASTMTAESSLHTPAKRKPIARPVACSDVSSSSHPDSTRFFITLSGAEPKPTQTVHSPKLRNSSRVGRLRSVGYFDQTDVLNDRKIRLGSRLVSTKTLHGEGRISAKHRLGPVIQSNGRIVSLSRSDENFDYTSENEFDDFVEGDYVELACDDAFVNNDGVDDENRPPLKGNYVPLSKISLAEKLSQPTPQLVVNLNETDEEEGEEDMTTFSAGVERQKKKINSLKHKEKIQNQTDMVTESETQPTIPSSLERCKFWPNCRNGSSCPYIHPTEPCQLFPRCKFGATCTFVHPPCRYGALCTRADCAFTHTAKKVLPVVPANPAQIVCRFQNRCTNPHCQFYHPPVVVQAPPIIVRSPNPTVPVFTSPIPCRYGSSCTNRTKCPFLHSDLPSVDQLKWIAPSKKQQSSNQISSNVNSTEKAVNSVTTVKE
ncbi:unnamed protein product [Schistosoma turkestanicum]|nr:unnamed protein product [Schistosoma turkestanicum]